MYIRFIIYKQNEQGPKIFYEYTVTSEDQNGIVVVR